MSTSIPFKTSFKKLLWDPSGPSITLYFADREPIIIWNYNDIAALANDLYIATNAWSTEIINAAKKKKLGNK